MREILQFIPSFVYSFIQSISNLSFFWEIIYILWGTAVDDLSRKSEHN